VQAGLSELEDRLWDAADELRANSGLKASEYAAPVLGLIFLRFADVRFEAARERIESKATSRRKIGPGDYQAEGLGSGGMFVHSACFVERHRGSPGDELSIFGQEKTADTVKLAKMNLVVHGLSISGDIRMANSYYEDPFKSFGHFDFVMANPPFNVDRIDKAKLVDDKRFPDLPKADNGNYIWIQLFANSLNETGRAGFVMANSASDARHSEAEIRRKLIEDGLVDMMVAVSSNFFYSVTLPVTLWFLDRGKGKTPRQNKVLFLDARQVFRQVDRAHRDFTEEQTEFLANIVRLYRDEKPELVSGD
jgi:type I restriction enzyme M protein